MFAAPLGHAEALGPGCAGPDLALPVPPPGRPQVGCSVRPSAGGPACAVDPRAVGAGPHQHTTTPYVTGTSVLGLVYKDGVMVACDTLGSYGSTKRYKSFSRLTAANGCTVVGAGGELSDFQYLTSLLEELAMDDACAADGLTRAPAELHSYLTRVLYNRRNKMDPLWNSLVVGGLSPDGTPFLGSVGMLGVAYTDVTVATGFGNHLARPLFREKHRPDMTEAEAEDLMKEALKVCYYRDKQSINKFQVAKVTAAGVVVGDPFALDTDWGYEGFVNPSSKAVGTW